ncbi:MAG TPA: hypothetical protein VK474_02350, partial [Chthoniobacterales bacterium]|nr:hypothetical protein [Chthoniobacterales bacterium]
MDQAQNRELQGRLARIEELIQGVDGIADEKVRTQVRALVQALLDLHATGLNRTLEMIYDSVANGDEFIKTLAQDDLVSNLLLLHGLHPLDLETRVRHALESVQPRLGQHGGSVQLVEV